MYWDPSHMLPRLLGFGIWHLCTGTPHTCYRSVHVKHNSPNASQDSVPSVGSLSFKGSESIPGVGDLSYKLGVLCDIIDPTKNRIDRILMHLPKAKAQQAGICQRPPSARVTSARESLAGPGQRKIPKRRAPSRMFKNVPCKFWGYGNCKRWKQRKFQYDPKLKGKTGRTAAPAPV